MSKNVETVCWYDDHKEWYDICISPIWNELLDNIHLVGDYKSDLIIDIDFIKNALSSEENYLNCKNVKDGVGVWWLGFRENGVDHLEYIFSSLLGTAIFGGTELSIKPQGEYYYRKLFKITTKIDNKNKMTVTIEHKTSRDFCNEYKNGGL